jgi:hypothetical protein
MEITINQNAVQSFGKTYEALLTTLVETYKDKDLFRIRQAYEAENAQELGQKFWVDIRDDVDKVYRRDPSLFHMSIPFLDHLSITSLWNQDKLSPNSKKYIWSYLHTLVRHAKAIATDLTAPVDIAPPDMPGMDKMYENLPKGVLDKVKQVADKYGEKIESGEQSMDTIRFDEISKELFENMSQDDMSGLVNNVGNVLQSLMGGQGGGDGSQIAEMLKSMTGGGGDGAQMANMFKSMTG